MAFQKANPMQSKLKVSIYGPPGSGKTFSTLLFAEGLANTEGKRVAFVDTERGTDFYAKHVAERQVHPEAFDFDALYTRSLKAITDDIRRLNPKEHGVIVLDSITHLWDAAMDAYTGKRNRADAIPMHAWGKIKKPYKDLISWLIASPYHVFILGRQKNLFDQDSNTGEMQKVGVAMKAEGETAYEPHICIRMEARQNPERTTQSDYVAYIEKDRTGVLSGKELHNPNFATIAPLLPLLGDVQAPEEDEEERIAQDSELHTQAEARDAKREEKSAALFTALQAKLAGAETLADVGAFAAEAKKSGRYMIDTHTLALREIYKLRREQLAAAAARVEI